ncbi:MAG: hypothetical protein IK092_02975 [Muribaculaceae bacterium]|nr:hypothetical protein [Muribaculaceae bacterium]
MKKLLWALLCVALSTPIAVAQEMDFINTAANHIELNGDDWGSLRTQLSRLKKQNGKFNIVQIGDSHVQPGLICDRASRMVQYHYGNGGRGLIAPWALAGTNEPYDYRISCVEPITKRSKLLSRTWDLKMGVTGVAVQWDSAQCKLSFRAKNKRDHSFSNVVLLHGSGGGYETARVGDQVLFGKEMSPTATAYRLSKMTDTVSMTLPCPTPFYGALLYNDSPGVVFHSIGNNGATFALYLKIDSFAVRLRDFSPQLVIISLGTNESLGNLDRLPGEIDRLVSGIRKANPNAKVLLTTPMENHKKFTTQVATKVKTGRARRAKYKTVYKPHTTLGINDGARKVRDIIMEYGRKNRVAVWDLYTIAGGRGSAAKWVAASLMNAHDHLHCLDSGYELQGMLLGDALVEVFKK